MRVVVLVLLQLFLSGCSRAPHPSPPPDLDSSPRLCVHSREQRCKASQQIAELVRDPEIKITAAGITPGGQQGAFLLNLRHPSGSVFSAKWRTMDAQTLIAIFSRPRREVVAYHLQQIFLESSDYVIPPTVPHCFPLDHYRKYVEKSAEPTWKEIPCVFGYLSFWIPDVETVAQEDESVFMQPHLFSQERFENDVIYARAVSALNIITFASEHGDSHAQQFVVMREEGNRLLPATASPAPLKDIALVYKDHKVYVGATMAERDLIWGKVQSLQDSLSSGELTIML